ncbi:MAG TPA: PBP1A family penicillin-binding protein [Candidatus Binataceae bacterium]|nr:PBP1A family penicillin-binding protein [Candidatus Binataceae bacterium]
MRPRTGAGRKRAGGGALSAAMKRALKIVLFGVLAILLFAMPPAIYEFLSYYHALENEVVTRFSGKRWNIPSRIYSDSCFVYPGQSLDDLGFFQRLARLNYHRVAPGQVTSRGEYSLDEKRHRLTVFLHNFAYPYTQFAGAAVEMTLGSRNTVLAMRDPLDGKALYSAELEPELISGIFQGTWQQRRLVPLKQIPQAFIDAILAAEDHRFYEHHGIDIVRIIKAAWVDFSAGRVRQGGSTLTQQLMKNFFLTSKRDWRRKAKEALMAYIAEREYSKDTILENYINDIYLGQRGQEGIYGVWEAAEFYFSKEPRDLTIGEMATIAGMISSPNRLNPLHHPKLAERRRNEVLGLMLADGYITKPAYDSAATEPLHPREVFTENNDAPYFVDYVKHELAERYPPEVLTGEGLRIFTTLDVHAQKLAEQAVRGNLDYLEQRYASLRRKEKKDQLEEALVAIEPQNGKIRAIVGGRDYRESQFDRVTQAKRQPGSAFKPITYLAALQETLEGGPDRFLPTTYIEDTPFTWTYGDMSWTPRNYKDRYFGRVTLEFALQESLNSATSRLANQIGLDRVRAMAAKMGFGDLPAYPSIVLGGIEVTPMQIAQAYSIMADYGLDVQSYAVTAVVDQNGKVIEGHELEARQVLSPQLAYMIDFMLEQVINHGTGEGARQRGFTRPAAGKTGTTNDSKDAWFAGFTPNLLTVVWTGFDQKEELGLTGAEASLPAWTAFMKAATASRPALDFAPPPGIVVEKVDPLTGYLAGPNCPVVMEGAFPTDLAPTQICPFHARSGATPVAGDSATSGTPPAGGNWQRLPSDPHD